MIPLPFAHVFSVYFICWFIVLAVLWFREELRRRRAVEWTVVKEHLYTCSNCHLAFMAKHDSENITRCPRCNEICFLRKKKRF